MKPTDTLVLPADLLFLRPDSLPPEIRLQLVAGADDLVLTRPHSRARSLVIGREAAAFIEQFRRPSTIVEAVLRHADGSGDDPQAVLESGASLLTRLRRHRFVSVVGEPDAASVTPEISPGDVVDGISVVECVHLFENVEVYRAHAGARPVALKILRTAAPVDSFEMLEREAAVLDLLAGGVAPGLLGRGQFAARPYLVQEWCEGVSASHAAAQVRRAWEPSRESLELCRAVIRAYVQLHASGVVHGDVHPGNIRVDKGGRVRLLDFGLSISTAAAHLPAPRRGGLASYFEPEYCEALLQGAPAPAATPRSDQYSLGALLYLMLTGRPSQDFALERTSWIRQVAEGSMVTFAARGMRPWPALEGVLHRTLAREPSARFPDVSELLHAFEAATLRSQRPMGNRGHSAFVSAVVDRLVPDGVSAARAVEAIRPPRCSVNYGASGIAWLLYRLACLQGEARLLAAADVWATQAYAHADAADAFASTDIRITPETVGTVSPFHYRSGLHMVDALVASAMGDLHRANRSVAEFVASCRDSGRNPDLTLGWSSLILGCVTLLEAMPPRGAVEVSGIRSLGADAAGRVSAWMADHSPGDDELPWYGIAHGWAGLLYALLRWSQAGFDPVPPAAGTWLEDLASVSRTDGDRRWWPVKRSGSGEEAPPQTGWCHGSAGYIQLWTLADQVCGSGYVALAEGAARHLEAVAGRDGNRNASLCCGFAGQAYGLLALYRSTKDAKTLQLARRLASHAEAFAGGSNRRDSLYKGDVGIAALLADLARPEFASMPLFEAEGWEARPA